MPSRFPGMDPYIEGQRWKGFHSGLINSIWDALVAALRPRYVIDVEESVYVVDDEECLSVRLPDVSISEGPGVNSGFAPESSTSVFARSFTMTLPMLQNMRQLSLQILRAADRELVTVLEVLSPWNKTGRGRTQYLEKREEILASTVNLVELDLLRGGERLPVRGQLPAGDFYAFVCRRRNRPRVEVFPWTLKQPLPAIPIPLAPDDDELPLDLQRLFTTTFDRAGYDYALDYRSEILPSLDESDRAWAAALTPPPFVAQEDGAPDGSGS